MQKILEPEMIDNPEKRKPYIPPQLNILLSDADLVQGSNATNQLENTGGVLIS